MRSNCWRADSLYNANHPRLLFTPQEIPALREKVRDGGRDDAAYAAIRDIVNSVYPTKTEAELFQDNFAAINIMPNLGLVAYLETPMDSEALAFGRYVTLYLVNTSGPDATDVFFSSLRLRTLVLGYDMFFADAPESLRTVVRNEILAYVDTTMTVLRYQKWLYSPYVSNYNTVIGSALGLAALCLEHEMPSDWVKTTIERADEYVATWAGAHLDPDGSYDEGAMYAGWSVRNLAYYFWARSRLYDHYDFSTLPGLRDLEKWLAFSTLPIGHAAVNNINDSSYLGHGLSYYHTYLDWAQTAYGSGVSAWLWERIVGPDYGYDGGVYADKPGTVLWHRGIPPVNPRDRLPCHMLWRQGLYYYRTGWPEGDTSDDVVFSFHSGKFMGGHAHEDQNNFTLWGYGTAFATDNGPLAPAKDTEGHNLVLIDGRGQHNAGGSIGTDGIIREHILSSFADYIFGDATSAYTTYSEFNRPGYPFPDDDWSWGYDGGNPVEFAHRRVAAVHEAGLPPYFVIWDEIRKDALPHLFEWRLHTVETNTVDLSANPICIRGGHGLMNLFVLSPAFDSLAVSQAPFDNGNEDPNTTVISLSCGVKDFSLCSVLLPDTDPPRHTVLDHASFPWGAAALLGWPDGAVDLIMDNRSGGEATVSLSGEGALSRLRTDGLGRRIVTDAHLAVLRLRGYRVAGLLANDVSRFDWNGIPYARIRDGKLNLVFSTDTIDIDRPDTTFTFYLPRGGEVRCEGSFIPVLNDGGFAVPDRTGTPPATGPIRLRAFPNPFNPTVSIVVDLDAGAQVNVAIYDVSGRLVSRLWKGPLPRGANLLRWPGLGANGEPAATGVYFIRAETTKSSSTIKAVLLK
ncbi:MAG: FlgD immunoglobulin-like domain containing protein [Candidatus Krumholzibacteriaceae bacterium]